MTFTEAAVEVLRQAGKPLHYKKITEIALEQNLLSHVGKTPETTMSSRLATMVKKDRGDAPIEKVGAGMFSLREGANLVLPPEDVDTDDAIVELDDSSDAPEAAPRERATQTSLPGADFFPEEADDDELILANLDEADEAQSAEGGGRRPRNRRGRRNGAGEGTDETRNSNEPRAAQPRQRDRERTPRTPRGERSERSERGERSDRNDRNHNRARNEHTATRGGEPHKPVQGDWARTTGADEAAGEDLTYAIMKSMRAATRTTSMRLHEIAADLTSSGRLQGAPDALAPTLAAAMRGDNARRAARGLQPRFRVQGSTASLVSQLLPQAAARAEQDAFRSAKRQRQAVHRALADRMATMPDAALMEFVATWLNAEGVRQLRGVRGPSGAYCLAGVMHRGPEQLAVGIAIFRDTPVLKPEVIAIRGAAHHFGPAKTMWILALAGTDEAAVVEARLDSAIVPVSVFDDITLAESMERVGVGIRTVNLPMAMLDFDFLDELAGPTNAQRAPVQRAPRVAQARNNDEREVQVAGDEESEQTDAETSADDSANPSRRSRSRRGRRRRGRRGGEEGATESIEANEALDANLDDAPENENDDAPNDADQPTASLRAPRTSRERSLLNDDDESIDGDVADKKIDAEDDDDEVLIGSEDA